MSTKKKEPKPIPMCNQVVGKPEMVFSRKHRWTLGGLYLLEHFIKDVKIDHYAKTIIIECYDVLSDKAESSLNGLKWATALQDKSLPDETLWFTTYDGCGSEIFKIEFDGISLLEHKCDFDYSSSEPSIRYIKVQFKDSYVVNPVDSSLPKKYNYKFNVTLKDKTTRTTDARIKNRPSLNVETHDLPYLNGKVSLPSWFKWEPLEIKLLLDEDDRFHLLEDQGKLIPSESINCNLELYLDDKVVERWTFKDALLWSISYQLHQTDIKLCLNSVEFESLKT